MDFNHNSIFDFTNLNVFLRISYKVHFDQGLVYNG